jgi:transketolase
MPDLQEIARQLRRDIIEMLVPAKSGHPGGSLSAADIMAVLYFAEMRLDPQNPQWPERTLRLKQGHHAGVIPALAERGFFPEKIAEIAPDRHFLQGHPDMKGSGVDMSTGSLDRDISAAVWPWPEKSIKNFRSTVLCDGEVAEGLVWKPPWRPPTINLIT